MVNVKVVRVMIKMVLCMIMVMIFGKLMFKIFGLNNVSRRDGKINAMSSKIVCISLKW